MGRHCLRQQGASSHALPDVLQDRPEAGSPSAVREQVERPQDGQACPNERIKLLIEDQEIGRAYLAIAAGPAKLRQKIELIADGKNVEAPLGEPPPGFILGLRRLDLLKNSARGIPDFAYEISHFVYRRAPLKGAMRAKFSIPFSD